MGQQTPMKSYDDKQKEALLKACAVCFRLVYFTDHAATVCKECR